MKRSLSLLMLLIVIVGLGTACGSGANETLPPPPTPLPSTGNVNEPETNVETGPLPTPTPQATLGAPPTIAPLPTTAVDNEPTPETVGNVLTAEDFGTDRNPLTGEVVSDPANLQRRPLAVKMANAPAIYTRPQSGLNDADLVFEHTTEGNLTRFTGIFYGETPPRIGPVRSARLIDVELPAMYDAALGFSGSSNGVGQRLQTADFASRILNAWEKGYYRTGEDKPIEHTLYADPLLMWEALDEKGENRPPNFTTTNVFSELPPEGGTPATVVDVDYNWTLASWRYDPNTQRYLRWSDGDVHADGNTGQQVSAANVIVIAPFHAYDATICEQINADGTCAAQSVEVQLWGSGGGAVFRDGQRYDVTWQRENRTDSLTFTDSEGNPFPLKIGNSWVQVVPTWVDNPLRVTP